MKGCYACQHDHQMSPFSYRAFQLHLLPELILLRLLTNYPVGFLAHSEEWFQQGVYLCRNKYSDVLFSL